MWAWPAASAFPEDLLEMRILKGPRPAKSESLGEAWPCVL